MTTLHTRWLVAVSLLSMVAVASCTSTPTSTSTATTTTTTTATTATMASSTSSAASTTAVASTTTVAASTTTTRFVLPEAQSQALLDQLVAGGAPGAIMAVSVHGGPPTILTSGVSDPKKKTPMKATDVMPIASVSKTFVGALALELVKDGKVALDKPISTYHIDFPKANVITVRELLSHTSGVPPLGGDTGGNDPYALAWQNKLLADLKHHFTIDEVLAYVHDRPLLFAPGTSTSYSNINTILLAKVIENVTGATWTAELHHRLLTPLHLSSIFDAGNEVPKVAPVPGLFVLQGNPTVLNNADFDHMSTISGFGPAGSLVATPVDLITWGNALLRNKTVLGPEMSDQAHKIAAGGTGLGVLGYGRSFFCMFNGCAPGTTFTGFGAPGSLPGARTLLLYDTATDSVLMIFANRTPTDIEYIVAPELVLIARAEKP
jgi:D-alanyl-D-alanine carboxypeptidase